MAGVRPEVLIRDLNVALAATPGQEAIALATSPKRHDIAGQPRRDDERIVHPPRATVIDLDVRDHLRAGREPFSRIMAAMSALAAGEVLHLRTLFEPVPLYTVLGKRGCLHEAQRGASDDWSVWFWRPAGDDARGTAAGLPAERGFACEVDDSRPDRVHVRVWRPT